MFVKRYCNFSLHSHGVTSISLDCPDKIKVVLKKTMLIEQIGKRFVDWFNEN